MFLDRIRQFRENHRKRRNRILKFLLLTLLLSALGAFIATRFIERPAAAPTPPIPQEWRQGYFDSPTFGGKVFTLQAGTEHNESVILLHGLGQNASRDWFTLIPELADRYHVIALDLPGFGRSQSPAADYTPAAYARFVHEIRTAYAKERTALVGHSMGAAVALRYAADYPGELSQLILVDAAGILERTAYVKEIAEIPLDRDDLPEYLQGAATSFENFASAIIEWLNLAPDPLDIVKGINRYWKQSGLDASQLTIALELLDEDYSSAVAALDLPCTILWGGRDRIAPLRTGKVLAAHIRGATLHIFPEAGHVPMAADPETFNAVVLATLGKAPSAVTPEPIPREEARDLHCKDRVGGRYSGDYETIIIDRCKGIELVDVTAKQIRITASSASFENLVVDSGATAFEADRSVILMTNARISGTTALRSAGSRLDMAGVSLKASERAVDVARKSRLIFSISDIDAPRYSGFVHGDYRLKGSMTFDDLLVSRQ